MRDGSVLIHRVILVERLNQKAIVIGKSGAQIKAIGEAARKELIAVLDRPVHLLLHVRVQEEWAEDSGHFRDLGLDWRLGRMAVVDYFLGDDLIRAKSFRQ